MKTFKAYIAEADVKWEHTFDRHAHTFTHPVTKETLRITRGTHYGKVAKSRLRDPKKTKYVMEIQHHDGKSMAKGLTGNHTYPATSTAHYAQVTNAESVDAREKKKKAHNAAIKKMKTLHGCDITPAFGSFEL